MIFKTMSHHRISLTIAMVLLAIGLASHPVLVQANDVELWNFKHSNQAQLDFARDGRPGKRTAGASRSGTMTIGAAPASDLLKTRLTAVVPAMAVFPEESSEQHPDGFSQEFVLGLTRSSHPTFWFYVPYASEQVASGEFVLIDENNGEIFVRQDVMLSGEPGIVGIRLPPASRPLEVGQSYHWYFSILLSDRRPSRNPFVHGQVMRVPADPTLERRLQKATMHERIEIYAANRLWHEAATLLAEMRYADPANVRLAADWGKLLRAVDLDVLERKPILGTLQPADSLPRRSSDL